MNTSFITSLYHSESSLPKDDADYNYVLKDDDIDTIASQLYYFLKKGNLINQTPLFFQHTLKQKFNQTVSLNMLIKRDMMIILTEFEQQEIGVIPIKGILFSERYFGYFGARATSDIDLLIKKSNLNKAVQVLEKLGFTIEGDLIQGHFHSSYSKPLPGSPCPLTVELHWNLIKEDTATFNVSVFWDDALPLESYKYVKQLSHYHTFYLMVLHGWRHNMDSLKYYIDIIQLITVVPNHINYELLMCDATRDMTKKRVVKTLSKVYDQFPFLNEIKPFPYQIHKSYWKHTKEEKFKTYLHFIDYQFFSYDSFKYSLIEFIHWVVPSQYELKNEQKGLYKYISFYKKRIQQVIKVFVP